MPLSYKNVIVGLQYPGRDESRQLFLHTALCWRPCDAHWNKSWTVLLRCLNRLTGTEDFVQLYVFAIALCPLNLSGFVNVSTLGPLDLEADKISSATWHVFAPVQVFPCNREISVMLPTLACLEDRGNHMHKGFSIIYNK